MSDYNKVIKNEDGITKEELMEVINRTVKGDNIYLNIFNDKGFPTPVKVTSVSSQFGCLYIDVPNIKPNDSYTLKDK